MKCSADDIKEFGIVHREVFILIRVLVVEDEAFLRKSIKNTIEQADSRFEVIAEAGDGITALDLIEQMAPDVVFMDICMPLLDGIGLLKEIQNSINDPICIILSGYSDFEYARSALRYQAFDYLLKPIDRQVLASLLEKIYSKVTESNYNIKRNIFEEMIHGKVKSLAETQVTQILKSVQSFYSFHICFGPYLSNTYRYLPPKADVSDDVTIFAKVRALCSDHEEAWIFHGNHPAEYLVIIASGGDEENQEVPSLLFSDMKEGTYPVTIIYGRVCKSIEELQNSIIDIKYSHMLNSVYGISSLQECRTSPRCSMKDMGFTAEFQKELEEILSKKEYDLFYQFASSILVSCKEKQCTQSTLLHILKRLSEIANCNMMNREIEEQIEEIFYHSEGYGELTISYEQLLHQILQPAAIEPAFSLIAEVRAYIDTHFMELLTLKDLSARFHISISYLCTLYKKEYDISPIDYIIEKRIKTSQAYLLKDPTYTIKQVAEKVGYSDAYYFSRLFKMYTGKTPSQYRKESSS
ncbi:response regulator [Blautia schinkii]|nr:response regulator [Blautia schinkii]